MLLSQTIGKFICTLKNLNFVLCIFYISLIASAGTKCQPRDGTKQKRHATSTEPKYETVSTIIITQHLGSSANKFEGLLGHILL